MKRLSVLITLLSVGMVIVISGCVAPPSSVQVEVLKPAAINIGSVRRIAISRFEGQGGDAVTNRLMAKIFEGGHFTVLEREKVNALVREMGLAEVGIVDPAGAAELGRALGAEGIIFGSVDGYVVQDVAGWQKVTKYNTVKTGRKVKKYVLFEGEKWVDETKQEPYEVILPYTIRQGRVAVTFKMINVETTELLAIKSITREYREKVVHDPDNPEELKSKGIILDELVDQTIDAFVKLVSPHYVVKKKIWEDTGTDEGKTAFKCLENHLYAEAGELLDELVKNPELKPEQLAAICYDRGLVYEILGNLNKAEEFYEQAVSLGASDLHLKALRNVRERMEEVKKLQEQQL